jgi:hypothetical protein
VLRPLQHGKLAGGAAKVREHAMSQKLNSAVAVIGIDIRKILLSQSNINYLARSISQGNTGGKRSEAR